MKHGKDPRTFGAVDPTLAPSWKKQYCFVEFCGTVSFDPVTQTFDSGARKLKVGLAWRQNKKDKATDEWKATYHYLDAEVWNDMADAMSALRKKDVITVKGILKVDSWEDKATGKKRFKPFIEVCEFELIERKDDPNLEGAKADEEWRKNKPSGFTSDSDDIPF